MQTISRQEFLSLVGTGAGAALLTACLSSCGKGSDPDPDPNANLTVDETLNLADAATYADLMLGNWQYLDLDGTPIIVARTTQGTYLAVSSICTHQQSRVVYSQTNNTFVCPNHGSVFTSAGANVSGDARSPLKKYDTTFDSAKNTLRIFG